MGGGSRTAGERRAGVGGAVGGRGSRTVGERRAGVGGAVGGGGSRTAGERRADVGGTGGGSRDRTNKMAKLSMRTFDLQVLPSKLHHAQFSRKKSQIAMINQKCQLSFLPSFWCPTLEFEWVGG